MTDRQSNGSKILSASEVAAAGSGRGPGDDAGAVLGSGAVLGLGGRPLPSIAGTIFWLSNAGQVPPFLATAAPSRGWTISTVQPSDGSPKDSVQLRTADLVLLDARSDQYSRLLVCSELKHQLLVLGMPVVALLAGGDEASRIAALRAGAADCIWPQMAELESIARLGTLLRLGSLERAHRQQSEALARQSVILEQRVADRTQESLRGRDAIIFGLAKLAESRDDTTGHHLERVCAYSATLAEEFVRLFGAQRQGIDAQWVMQIEQTAALHDIGKVGIPDGILLKAGPLTAEERMSMQRHPNLGGDTLNSIRLKWGDNPYIVTAMQIALGHHEKWNGTGYPFGLAGENIPLPARIVAVADVYDALTTARPYKAAFSHERAFDAILGDAGTHFDPEVIEVFKRCKARFDAIRMSFAETGGAPIKPLDEQR